MIDHFTTEQIANNWSQLKDSIYVAQHLAILGFLGGPCERMQKHANAWSWRCMHIPCLENAADSTQKQHLNQTFANLACF